MFVEDGSIIAHLPTPRGGSLIEDGSVTPRLRGCIRRAVGSTGDTSTRRSVRPAGRANGDTRDRLRPPSPFIEVGQELGHQPGKI